MNFNSCNCWAERVWSTGVIVMMMQQAWSLKRLKKKDLHKPRLRTVTFEPQLQTTLLKIISEFAKWAFKLQNMSYLNAKLGLVFVQWGPHWQSNKALLLMPYLSLFLFTFWTPNQLNLFLLLYFSYLCLWCTCVFDATHRAPKMYWTIILMGVAHIPLPWKHPEYCLICEASTL